MTDRLKEIENLLPDRLKNSLFSGMFGFRVTYDGLEEIRLRCAQPAEIRFKGKDYRTDKVIVAPQDIRQCLEYMSHYSLYAFQEEIRQGYLTVRGGHRIGVLGRAVLENGIVTGQTSLSFLNIRVAHEKIGCADIPLAVRRFPRYHSDNCRPYLRDNGRYGELFRYHRRYHHERYPRHSADPKGGKKPR